MKLSFIVSFIFFFLMQASASAFHLHMHCNHLGSKAHHSFDEETHDHLDENSEIAFKLKEPHSSEAPCQDETSKNQNQDQTSDSCTHACCHLNAQFQSNSYYTLFLYNEIYHLLNSPSTSKAPTLEGPYQPPKQS